MYGSQLYIALLKFELGEELVGRLEIIEKEEIFRLAFQIRR